MIICGIDPGLDGAVAFVLNEQMGLDVSDMPTFSLVRNKKNKREVDAVLLADLLDDVRPNHAFVEQVGAMPGQGVSSVFAFGRGYGIVIGVLAALKIPHTFVPSPRWKRTLRVPSSKDGARSRASELMPHAAYNWKLVKHDGRAEAALIALYGYREMRNFNV
jgi:crossover junction endodeoxyribonuclease RuvC